MTYAQAGILAVWLTVTVSVIIDDYRAHRRIIRQERNARALDRAIADKEGE